MSSRGHTLYTWHFLVLSDLVVKAGAPSQVLVGPCVVVVPLPLCICMEQRVHILRGQNNQFLACSAVQSIGMSVVIRMSLRFYIILSSL
jgi:hypothetical protein